jgi:hypothetical protein
MTIDEAIDQLYRARALSPLGGRTVLVTCLVDSEIPYLPVDSLKLELDGDGALLLSMSTIE